MFNRVQAFWSQSHKRDGFALGLAVGTFGITFGVLANAAGISDLMAVVLSLFVFTGASQFAAVGVVNAGGEPLTALGTALLLRACGWPHTSSRKIQTALGGSISY